MIRSAIPVWEFVRKLMPSTPPGLAFEPDEGKVYSQLFQGKSAMQIAGSWHVSWAKASGLENAIYGAVPYPEGGNPASYVVGNVIYGVMSATKVPDVGARWVMVSQSDDVQKVVLPAPRRLPSTMKAIDALWTTERVDARQGLRQAAARRRPGHPAAVEQGAEQAQPNWNDLFAAVITTEADVKQLADEAQAKAEEILKAAG